jgi:hypothetical protein
VLALAGAGDHAVEVGARLAALALLALVSALVLGWSSFVPLSLALLGATYAVHLSVDDTALDTKAPLFAAGLLLTAELAYWSLEERERVRSEPGDSLRHLGLVAALGLLGLVAAAAVLAVADLARAGGLAVDVLGAAAAAAVLLVVVLLARRGTESS